jgi:hypothetical protein
MLGQDYLLKISCDMATLVDLVAGNTEWKNEAWLVKL